MGVTASALPAYNMDTTVGNPVVVVVKKIMDGNDYYLYC
jgi:hypothetical protein